MRKNLLHCFALLFLTSSIVFTSHAEEGESTLVPEEVYKSDMTTWTFSKLGGNETWKPMSEEIYFDDWTPTEKEQTGCDTGIGVKYDDDNDTDAWAVSPAIELTGNQLYRITIYVKAVSMGDPENWKLVVGTDDDAASLSENSEELENITGFSTNNATKYSKDFTPSESGDYYFGLNCYSEAENYGMYATGFSIDKMVDLETGIETIISTNANSEYIDITGYKTSAPRTGGVYIKIENGRAKKVIKK